MNPTPETDHLTRREFVRTTSALAATSLLAELSGPAMAAEKGGYPHPLLTPGDKFEDVSRGNPKPHTLKGDALIQARLTPETWRLEITADATVNDVIKQPATITKPVTLDAATLMELGKKHSVKFLKAMQCLNIATPLGQGLWEGVPLHEVLRLCGKMSNVRRIYYWGFHNNDPKQLFQSSLSYTEAMETPPGELPAFLAYRLNGEPISLLRGGPVRMIIPWAHGFKSIKWIQQIVLTNDYKSNDTYSLQNNDPESHLKTAAYMDSVAEKVPTGQPVFVSGLAMSGLSGLQRVECWVRPRDDKPGVLAEDDPAWQSAKWTPCQLDAPPADWSRVLPAGTSSKDVLGFDPKTGKPATWPLRYSMISWTTSLKGLPPGRYEVRARAVDLNGYPQPEPRPIQKTGKNNVEVRNFDVV